jgi:tetratricopeptide (TPR) repeat protein
MPAPARRTGAIAAIALLVVAAIGVATFWFWRQHDSAATGASNAITAAPSAPPVVPIEDDRLRRARAAEEQENYRDAIQQYEAYLAANPRTTEAAALQDRVALLTQVSGKLAMAELELKQKDYAAARRDFAEAIKLRRESKRAQAGLMEAEAGLGK